MNDLHDEWSARWRSILNVSSDEDTLDIDEDFDLQGALWDAGQDEMEECFALFPGGDRMFERAQEVRSSKPVQAEVGDETLLSLLEKMEKDTEVVLKRASLDVSEYVERRASSAGSKSVYRGDDALRLELFESAISPTAYLDDHIPNLAESMLGREARAAYFFLMEPLYWMTSYHSVGDWVFWGALHQQAGADPYAHVFDLYKVRAQAGWSESEMFVFLESD